MIPENVPLEYSQLTDHYLKNQTKLVTRNKKFFQILFDPKEDEAYFFKPAVRSLYEYDCRQNYFRSLKKKFKNVCSSKVFTFCTLTYSTKLYDPEQVSARCKKDIALLMKRLRRSYTKLEYFYIVELTKKFQPHFHIVFNSEIPKSEIRKDWYEITGSYIVDIEKVWNQSIDFYLTKELSKSKRKSEQYWQFFFYNFKRLWTSSRGFFYRAKKVTKKFYILFKDYNIIRTIFAHALTEIQNFEERLTKLPDTLKDYCLQQCDGSWSDSIILEI